MKFYSTKRTYDSSNKCTIEFLYEGIYPIPNLEISLSSSYYDFYNPLQKIERPKQIKQSGTLIL